MKKTNCLFNAKSLRFFIEETRVASTFPPSRSLGRRRRRREEIRWHPLPPPLPIVVRFLPLLLLFFPGNGRIIKGGSWPQGQILLYQKRGKSISSSLAEEIPEYCQIKKRLF